LQKKGEKDIVIEKKSYNPVKEHSIDVLNRLEEDRLIGKGKKKAIVIKRKDFIAEHEKLIPILKKGTKKQQLKEALDQLKELEKEKKK
jgi:hypothetical protein